MAFRPGNRYRGPIHHRDQCNGFDMQVVSLSDVDPHMLERATSPVRKLNSGAHPLGSPCSSTASDYLVSEPPPAPAMLSPFAAVSAADASGPAGFTRDSSSSMHERQGAVAEDASRSNPPSWRHQHHQQQQQQQQQSDHDRRAVGLSHSRMPSHSQQSHSQQHQQQRGLQGAEDSGRHELDGSQQYSQQQPIHRRHGVDGHGVRLDAQQPQLQVSAASDLHQQRSTSDIEHQDQRQLPHYQQHSGRTQEYPEEHGGRQLEHEPSGTHDPMRNPEGMQGMHEPHGARYPMRNPEGQNTDSPGNSPHEPSGARDPMRNPEGTTGDSPDDTPTEPYQPTNPNSPEGTPHQPYQPATRALSGIHDDIRSDSAEEHEVTRNAIAQPPLGRSERNLYEPTAVGERMGPQAAHADIDASQAASAVLPGPDVVEVQPVGTHSGGDLDPDGTNGTKSLHASGLTEGSETRRGEPGSAVVTPETSIQLDRQLSIKHTTLITPSEQVEELRGDISAAEAADGYLGGPSPCHSIAKLFGMPTLCKRQGVLSHLACRGLSTGFCRSLG